MKLVLVDNSGHDTTARILRTAADDYNVLNPDAALTIERVTTAQWAGSYRECDDGATVLAVVVSDDRWSRVEGPDAARRLPCESLAWAQSQLRSDEHLRVILVWSGAGLTGLDVAAALLMGFCGIIDERGLASPAVLEALFSHQVHDRRRRCVLLVGLAVSVMQAAMDLVHEWNEDPTVAGEDVDRICWQACVALAQLKRIEPIVSGGKHPYAFTNFADALNLAAGITGFRLTLDDLRKPWGDLARRLLGSNYKPVEMITLPTFARDAGFPKTPPAIAGIPHNKLVLRLYYVVRDAVLRRGADVDQLACGVVCLPQEEYRRYAGR